jgi:large subunit ribosomal protein L25
MGEISLAVEVRQGTGKGANRRLRREGRIPGVVYGAKSDAVSISLDGNVLDRLIRTSHAGINTLIDLQGPREVSGKTVLVKELQREPVRGALMHADLYEIEANATVTVNVPVHLTGTAHGVTMGGLIDHALREIEVECLARAIPDEIIVDVSALDVGDSIHVADLVLPEGVELQTPGELSVVSVVAPRVAEEASAEAAAVGAEPALVSDSGSAAGEEGDKSES